MLNNRAKIKQPPFMNKIYVFFCFFQDRVVEITVAVKGSIVCISHQKLDDEVNEQVKAQGKGRLLKPACI